MEKYFLRGLVESFPERFCGNYIHERRGDGFFGHTYLEFTNNVKGFAGYLQNLGLIGKKVGIYSENSYGYMVADMAVMTYVGTSVCISKDWKYADLERGCGFIGVDALVYSKSKEVVFNIIIR